jgi:hypothetical protein
MCANARFVLFIAISMGLPLMLADSILIALLSSCARTAPSNFTACKHCKCQVYVHLSASSPPSTTSIIQHTATYLYAGMRNLDCSTATASTLNALEVRKPWSFVKVRCFGKHPSRRFVKHRFSCHLHSHWLIHSDLTGGRTSNRIVSNSKLCS